MSNLISQLKFTQTSDHVSFTESDNGTDMLTQEDKRKAQNILWTYSFLINLYKDETKGMLYDGLTIKECAETKQKINNFIVDTIDKCFKDILDCVEFSCKLNYINENNKIIQLPIIGSVTWTMKVKYEEEFVKKIKHVNFSFEQVIKEYNSLFHEGAKRPTGS